MKVAVDGATGYVGNHVVAALRQNGIDVRCIVHAGSRREDCEFLSSTGAEVVQASLETAGPDLVNALKDCDIAIHLIGSIAPKKGETLESLHAAQTANLVKAAKEAGIRKIIQVTALGTAGDAISEYHRTKYLAEENVRNSRLPYIIYRPSLIIGKTIGNRNSKLVTRYMEIISKSKNVPVIGGGENKVQPVFVVDLANAIVAGVTTDRYDNNEYEIGGNEVLRMKDFVEKLIVLRAEPKKSIKPISPFFANLMATFCEAFQDVPLVSHDQVKLSSIDNICKDNALEKVFGVKPTPIDKALETYRNPVGADLLVRPQGSQNPIVQ